VSGGPFGRRSEPVGESPPPEPEPQGPGPAPPAAPRGISSATWIVGVVVVLALAYITLNTLRTEAPGSRGIIDGRPLPPFAAPLATGSLQGDAQVDPDKACKVRGEDVVNSCALREAGPSVIAFLATRSVKCEDQIDVLERVRARHPDVGFAAIGIRGERGDLSALVRKRGWTLPVAHDRDGAVANLFAVAVCPTMTFARADGKVDSTSLGLIGEAEIERRITAAAR
jgi:hypothetical protein